MHKKKPLRNPAAVLVRRLAAAEGCRGMNMREATKSAGGPATLLRQSALNIPEIQYNKSLMSGKARKREASGVEAAAAVGQAKRNGEAATRRVRLLRKIICNIFV